MILEAVNDRRCCLVCGDATVLHRHFGCYSCGSCAAFFRRTIAKRRQYSCRKGPACNIDEKRHKGRCAYCRFQRCLIVGLNPQLVMDNIVGFLSEGDGSLLSNLRLWHRAMFVARRQNYVIIYGKKSYFDCYEEAAIPEAWIRAVKIEGMTFRDFLRNIGLIESEAYGSVLEISMCSQLLFLWMCVELAFNTRAHSGHRLNRAYYLDESYMNNNEEVITQFYLQNPALHSPRSLAINVMPFFRIIIDTAELLQRLAIDDLERQAVMLICLCNKLNRTISTNKKYNTWLNDVFKNLHNYYTTTNSDMATRFGQICLCVEAIEKAHTAQLDFFRCVLLDYRDSNMFGYDTYSGDLFD